MMISCKCLNILLNFDNELANNFIDNNSDCKIFLETVQEQQQQSTSIKNFVHLEQFFKEAFGPIKRVLVTKQLNDLVRSIKLDVWNIFQCVNCEVIVFAENDSKEMYLVNPTLFTNQEEINSLQSNENFSKIFGILINYKTKSLDNNASPNKNVCLDSRLQNLSKHLRAEVQREFEATAERISRYTEQQDALLKVYREKAEFEYQIIASLIKSVPDIISSDSNNIDGIGNQKMSNLDTPPATPDSIPMSIGNSPTFKQQQIIVGANNIKQYTPVKARNVNFLSSSKTTSNQQHSMNNLSIDANDSEFLFDMDGIDKPPLINTQQMSDVEESDTDESINNITDGISIPRSVVRQKSLTVPQSLPITMPIVNDRLMDNAYNEQYTEDNIDIAASIKALAKSVHGDAIFGDLPRPRFSTQI